VVEKTDMNAAKLYSISNGYSNPLPAGELAMGSLSFKLDTKTEQHTAPLKKDLDRMIANIQEARRQADYVLVSIHSHRFAGLDTVNPAEFMQIYCKACIDAGADAILGHGPHELQGIEIYNGKPIVYSMGNFLFKSRSERDQKDSWYYGYISIIEITDTITLKTVPYKFNKDVTDIVLLGSEMEEYIKKISEIIGDPVLLKKYFRGWAWLHQWVPSLSEGNYNAFDLAKCEAHHSQMKEILEIYAEKDFENAKYWAEEVKKLQIMPV
jgi:hypothetical protein